MTVAKKPHTHKRSTATNPTSPTHHKRSSSRTHHTTHTTRSHRTSTTLPGGFHHLSGSRLAAVARHNRAHAGFGQTTAGSHSRRHPQNPYYHKPTHFLWGSTPKHHAPHKAKTPHTPSASHTHKKTHAPPHQPLGHDSRNYTPPAPAGLAPILNHIHDGHSVPHPHPQSPTIHSLHSSPHPHPTPHRVHSLRSVPHERQTAHRVHSLHATPHEHQTLPSQHHHKTATHL